MTGKEALDKICKDWHCSMAYAYKRCPYHNISGDYCGEYETIRKDLETLEEHKRIEEELGVDLITYFKIKKAQTVFVKEMGNDISEMIVRNSKNCIDVCYKGFINISECDTSLYIKDYGKTWALTKEELEK